MCVLDCAPQALRYLYNKEFMPFVVVISPPDLTDQWQINKAKPNPRTEEQLQMTIEENKLLLSSEYAKMFHLILPNRNIDITFRRLILSVFLYVFFPSIDQQMEEKLWEQILTFALPLCLK